MANIIYNAGNNTTNFYIDNWDEQYVGYFVSTTYGGDYSHAEGANTISSGDYSHAEGSQTIASGSYSHAEGIETIATGQSSHAEGGGTIAHGTGSHSEGYGTQADGNFSHAEGVDAQASGDYSHAEGYNTVASGDYSHAEGFETIASGESSHAEGQGTVASGYGSHAEGLETTTSGSYSHAEGLQTVASADFQHVQGQWNISSSAQSAFIHGNGTADNARSNLIFASGSQVQITGSLLVSGSITGSLFGTASYALLAISSSRAVSSSFASTASYSKNLQISGSINNVDYIDFNTGSVVTQPVPGRLSWNDTDGTLDLGMKGGNVTQQIGQETLVRVVNKTATNITLLEANYQAVRLTGAQGLRLKVDLAQAINDGLSAETLGLVTETIANNQEGFITTNGLVRGINTTGNLQSEFWSDGDVLYLSPTVAGNVTNIKPIAPNHLIIIGYVVSAHITQGSIFVKVDNGYEIDELHNVKISTGSLTPGQLLVRSGSVWINSRQLTGSYGLTGSLQATSFTGSLFGTSSYATQTLSSSFATSASYAPDTTFPYTGSAKITGSLALTGSFTVSGSSNFTGKQTITGPIELLPGTNGLMDTALASYLYVTTSGDNSKHNLHYKNNGVHWEQHWIENVVTTGISWGGTVTFSGSMLYVKPGAGIIVNYNASTSSQSEVTPTYVPFGPITASATYATSSQISYLLIDESGALQQQTTPFTNQQFNEKLPLGYITTVPATGTIVNSNDARITSYGQTQQSNEFIRAFGPLKLSGFDIAAQSGSLRVSIGSGKTFRYGGFYKQNPNDPSFYEANAVPTGSIIRIYQNPNAIGGFTSAISGAVPFTVIDPTKWDDGSGTLQTVSGSEWTIQRAFQGPLQGFTYVYYGQSTYSSLTNALQAISTDSFVESPISILAAPFIGYIVVNGATTNLGDTTNNRILQSGLFRNTIGGSGGSGAGTQNLDDLNDVTISSPTTGQPLVYNSGVWQNLSTITANVVGNAQTATSAITAQTSSYSTNILGTTNYVSKFTGANSLGDSLIYDDGTNVSIGTTSGSLNVNGFANFTGTISSSIQPANNPSASLMVIGGTTIQSASLTNSSAVVINTIMSASANSQALVGLDIAPTFSTGSFTSVATTPLRVFGGTTTDNFLALFAQKGITPQNSSTVPNSGKMVSVQGDSGAYFMGRDVTNNIEFVMGTSVVGSSFVGSITNHALDLRTNNINKLKIFTTGNVTLQNGGTFTDAGYRLDVSGSARITNGLTVTGSLNVTGSSNLTGSFEISNGTDSVKISRGSGAAGRLIISRPGSTGTQAISIGGANSELSIGTDDTKQIKASGASVLELSNTAGGASTYISAVSSTGKIAFRGASNIFGLTFFSDTKNVVLQNGGTFTDAGYRLDVSGSARITDGLTVTGSLIAPSITGSLFGTASNVQGGTANYIPLWNTATSLTTSSIYQDGTGNIGIGTTSGLGLFNVTGTKTAASAIARGTHLTPTLVASANSDVLAGLDIAPTFSTGSFTGVNNLALKVNGFSNFSQGIVIGSTAASPSWLLNGLYIPTGGVQAQGYIANSGFAYNWGESTTKITGYSSGATQGIELITSSSIIQKIFGTGNTVFQKGGTFTDAGYRLQVSGSTSGSLFVNGFSNFTGTISSSIQPANNPSASLMVIGGTTIQSGSTSLNSSAVLINPIMSASANSQALVGLDIAPTFTLGAFTGVNQYALRVTGNALFNNTVYTQQVRGLGADITVSVSSTSNSIFLQGGSTNYLKLIGSNGNLLLQNGGTFTDAGYRLQVSGSTSGSLYTDGFVNHTGTISSSIQPANNPSASLMVIGGTTIQSSSLTNSSAVIINPIMSASANSQALIGLDIAPTFSTGSFTGVVNYGARINGGILNTIGTANLYTSNIIGGNTITLHVATPTTSNFFIRTDGTGTVLNAPQGSGNLLFRIGNSTQGQFAATTGNFILQNGGTFTDDTVNRLQVSGSARITNGLTVTGSATINGGITGSLFGTASYALTASYAENAGGGGIGLGLVQAISLGLQNIF